MKPLRYTVHGTLALLMGALLLNAAGCLNSGSATARHQRRWYPPAPVSTTPSMSEPRNPGLPQDAIYSTAPTPLYSPGKIYVRGDYLFVSERGGGVHVYDNHNPSRPVNLSYIQIPGNNDVAVKDRTLYADSHGDLVSVDITDPQNARLLRRVSAVFPAAARGGQESGESRGRNPNHRSGRQTWLPGRADGRTMRRPGTVGINGEGAPAGGDPVAVAPLTAMSQSSTGTPASGGSAPIGGTRTWSGSGTAGSTARLVIVGNYLYVVGASDLKVFNITDPANPTYNVAEHVGQGVETIFPYGNKLFIGSQLGMYIYDNSNPNDPRRTGQFTHARSCDPVVTDGNRAYVTLRGGGPCGGTINQLDVIDISNLNNPRLVSSYSLSSPYGLAVEGSTLFVCDGDAGLKVYDAQNPGSLRLLSVQHTPAFDVILYRSTAIVTGSDGLWQYDYRNPERLRPLSHIPSEK